MMMCTVLFGVVLMTIVLNVSSFTGGLVPANGVLRNNRDSPQLFEALKDSNPMIDVVSTEDRVSMSKPVIHWTVPGFKVGWRDDEGNWFDEDGPRNGPPLNYWRQNADEREYNQAMGVADAVLSEYDIESEVKRLEKRSSVRKPSLSRKMLGRWAPLLLSSRRIAYNDKPSDDGGDVGVPFVIEISRSDGRRFGPGNHYGTFDLPLENGEELSISTTGGCEHDNNNVSAKIIADEANEPVDLGTVGQAQLQFGGITYVSDYVMIQRRPDGAIDFFLRADESYLGATAEDKGKYHLV